jgi:hypothetical protein
MAIERLSMRTIELSGGFLLLLLAMSCCEAVDPGREEWQPLFNGKDLSGWTPKIRGYPPGENFGNTFRVEDSVLRVSYDRYDTFGSRYGHLFYNVKYSYYRIAAEYRFTGRQAAGGEGWAERNSGIMVHGQSAESMGLHQDFPISIEVQLLGGLGRGRRSTANLCTPGTHVVIADTLLTEHCIPSRSKTYDGNQWVRAEVLVLGDSLISHFVNGEEVLTYSQPQIGGGVVDGYLPDVKQDGKLLNEGYISLQSESHPVEFRKVELLNLKGCKDPKARNYKSYYVKADNSSCRY